MINIALIQKVQNITSSGLPMMEGRIKEDITEGVVYNINEIGFLKGDTEEFVVFTTKESDEAFYYGGSIITQKIKEIQEVLSEEEVKELLASGLEVTFQKKTSKNKKKYMSCIFFPTK